MLKRQRQHKRLSGGGKHIDENNFKILDVFYEFEMINNKILTIE